MVTLHPRHLEDFYREVLVAAGAVEETAAIAASGLIYAELHGFDTHGGANLERVYVTKLRSGEIDGMATPATVLDTGAVALIDARRGLGYAAAARAMDAAVGKALQFGIGAAGVRHSTHCGCMGFYTAHAAAQGAVSLAFTNLGGQAILRPPGGARALIGTNVVAAAAPSADRPVFNLDMSTAVVSTGHVRRAQREGQAIPEGWLVDDDGRPLTNPDALFDGSGHLVFLGNRPETGVHKGYGLALLADILCGALVGAGYGPASINSPSSEAFDAKADLNIGHFFIAINAVAFRSANDYAAAMEDILGTLLSCPPLDPNQAVAYPGAPEHRTAAIRAKEGVPMADVLYRSLVDLAKRLGLKEPRVLDAVG